VQEGMVQPEWVTNLIDSGLLTEVHKFSKFIHGCATLFPDDVQAVPYWTDDDSIRESILRSGGGVIEQRNLDAGLYADVLGHSKSDQSVLDNKNKPRKHVDDDDNLATPLNHPPKAAQLNRGYQTMVQPAQQRAHYHSIQIEDKPEGTPCCPCPMADCWLPSTDRKMPMKIEPKIFFANERTFLKWMHMSVTLASLSVAMLAFSESNPSAELYGLMLLPISIGFICYALWTFLWRARKIRYRTPGEWDDKFGPYLMSGVLVLALTINFVLQVAQLEGVSPN